MTTHATSPTKTLELGDTIVLRGHNLTVRLCGCGHQYSIDVPADLIDNAGLRSHQFVHGPLESLTEAVQALFRAYPPIFEDGSVPALAVGQKWRTRGGKIVTIKAGNRDFAVDGDVGIPWWYSNHARGKDCHAPGILSADHPDTLVELVEAIKLELTPREAETLLILTRFIGGEPDRTRRKDTSAIQEKLGNAGVKANWDFGRKLVSGTISFGDEPAEAPKAPPRIEPVFKEGQVWRTKGGYLMRVHKIDPNGMGRARVIHTPPGKDRVDYELLWGIHPGGGYFGHESGTDDLTEVGGHDQMPKGNTDDRFAFVEPIAD